MIENFEEQQEIRKKFKEFLNKNKRGVDKYLQMEYNIAVKNLIREDSDRLRGQIEFIEKLRNQLDLS